MTSTRLAAVAAVCGLAGVVAPLGATAGKPKYGCAPGLNLGAQTFASYLTLPRTQAAIADGLATAQDILASLEPVDKNGNGIVCVQLSHGFEVNARPYGGYFYEVNDDNASVPSGIDGYAAAARPRRAAAHANGFSRASGGVDLGRALAADVKAVGRNVGRRGSRGSPSP